MTESRNDGQTQNSIPPLNYVCGGYKERGIHLVFTSQREIIKTLKVTNIDFFTQKSSLPTYPIEGSLQNGVKFFVKGLQDYIYIYTLNRHKFDYYSTGLTPGGNARKDEINRSGESRKIAIKVIVQMHDHT